VSTATFRAVEEALPRLSTAKAVSGLAPSTKEHREIQKNPSAAAFVLPTTAPTEAGAPGQKARRAETVTCSNG